VSSIGDSIQKLRDKLGSMGKRGGGDSSSGGSKMDAKKVMSWVKTNPVIVASIAVMVLAPAAAWWFSSDLHAAADEQTAARAKEMASLESLEKTAVEIALPGQAPSEQSGVVTPKMVAAYEELTKKLREDAVAVQRAALKHNQKQRTQLATDISVRPDNVNVVAEAVLSTLRQSVEAALVAAKAGAPPDDLRVIDLVQRRQDQFIAGEKKLDRKSLTSEELTKLNKALAEKRLQVYADAAASVSFYADLDSLGLPRDKSEAGTVPSEAKMFYWQWRCWMVEDVIRAVARANQPFRSVVEAPVKRIVSIQFVDASTAEVVEAPKSSAPGAPPVEGEAAPAAGPTGPPLIDPKMAVPYNFAASLTGRQSNPVYDVRRYRVTLIVATASLPDFLNAVARENFMTVVNMSMSPANAFQDAVDGYIYGADAVSRVVVDIESIWLREWIGKLMPKSLQAVRGTDGRTVDDAMAPTTGSAPAESPASNNG
jgi:hypothetical protein